MSSQRSNRGWIVTPRTSSFAAKVIMPSAFLSLSPEYSNRGNPHLSPHRVSLQRKVTGPIYIHVCTCSPQPKATTTIYVHLNICPSPQGHHAFTFILVHFFLDLKATMPISIHLVCFYTTAAMHTHVCTCWQPKSNFGILHSSLHVSSQWKVTEPAGTHLV